MLPVVSGTCSRNSGGGGPPAASAGVVGAEVGLLRLRSALADGEMVDICEDRGNDCMLHVTCINYNYHNMLKVYKHACMYLNQQWICGIACMTQNLRRPWKVEKSSIIATVQYTYSKERDL